MQNEIIRETRKVFIRRKVDQTDRKMTLRMITENRIEGVLRCEIRHMDGESWLYYEITGLHNLRDLYENRLMESGDVTDLILGLNDLCKRLSDFFISERQLLLSPEEIYRDVETGRFFFQIDPRERDGEAEKLLDHLITVMDHENEAFTKCIYEAQDQAEKGFVVLDRLAERLTEENHVEDPGSGDREDYFDEDLSGYDEENLFGEEEEMVTIPSSKEIPGKSGKVRVRLPGWAKTLGAVLCCMLAVFALGTYLKMHMLAVIALELLVVAAFLLRELALRLGKKKPLILPAEEVDEAEMDETEVLFQKKEPELTKEGETVPQTVYMEAEEAPAALWGQGEFKHLIFHIEGDMMSLGKAPEFADLVIPDPTVSRLHARIYRDEKGCRIRDLDSLNGTFLNGVVIGPEKEAEIRPGDELSFGRATFLFR